MSVVSLEMEPPAPALAAGHPSLMGRVAAWFVRSGVSVTAWSLTTGCLLALAVRLLCRDAVPAIAPFYYATPLILIWWGFAIAGVLFFALKKPRWGIPAACMTVMCWGWWQHTQVIASPAKTTASESVRVVFWNAARLKAAWEPVADQITKMSSPVMGFVEAGRDEPEDRERWTETFPDHQPVFFGNGMVLLTQGKLIRATRGRLGKGSYYGRATLEIAGSRVTFLVIDIHSNPFLSRETPFRELDKLLATFGDEPLVLMGDFNTPVDSVYYKGLRTGFSHAFESAGTGHLATWPSVSPVLVLDQIWVRRGISLNEAWHCRSAESDHLAVAAELLPPNNSP